MSDAPKRFEDWTSVDCNECARYWDSSCDGVKCDTNSDKALTGSTRLCNSFKPTRSIVIPAKLKAVEKAVRAVQRNVIFLLGFNVAAWVALFYLVTRGLI